MHQLDFHRMTVHIPTGAHVVEWTLLRGSQLECGPCGLWQLDEKGITHQLQIEVLTSYKIMDAHAKMNDKIEM